MRAVLAALILCACAAAAQAEIASWYDEGQLTASGEHFDPEAMTAAHRTLRFGARVRVCRHGRCVVVRINDRGPAARTGRDIDLSRAAARALGLLDAGVGAVEVKVLP
jgi:rare lipoprotein A